MTVEEDVTLIRGGDERFSGKSHEVIRRASETLGQVLQVKNLAVLVGAGASMHLGSPAIRGLSQDDVIAFSRVTSGSREADLLGFLTRDTPVDLEKLLASLSSIVAFGMTTQRPFMIETQQFEVDTVETLRLMLNRALVAACRLPREGFPVDDQTAPLGPHREFVRRLLRARRGDLPRVRMFTTNYDLLIEQALDLEGIAYSDGFAGTVKRTFRPETYTQDLYVAPRLGERRMMRLSEFLYLYKLHGSINWVARRQPFEIESSIVLQVESEKSDPTELALIYPTPHKEADVLAYPYADLLQSFGAVLRGPETALLIIGYGFMDGHVNRLIQQALQSSATFNLFVVDPHALADNKPSAKLASIHDARIAVLSGSLAKFERFATTIMPDPDLFEMDIADEAAREISDAFKLSGESDARDT